MINQYTEIAVCGRCGLEKHMELDRAHGYAYTRKPKYTYPDGFLADKGVHLTQEDFITEYYERRVTSGDTTTDKDGKATVRKRKG
jgi:hypothetical protein